MRTLVSTKLPVRGGDEVSRGDVYLYKNKGSRRVVGPVQALALHSSKTVD